ncbi:hypothetical protein [Lacipirellula parvula]|uniref:Uncharacterized protein n=1 Tax=Lacipirellula parvula TaxID=2650471 RepID=A0A5K7XJQ7_9BACT|nr:hypothetical protein [Lacipirellula parvula]BBO34473.1 hypothetical protein PLANPX_4085 [Lacipirellula parvula]
MRITYDPSARLRFGIELDGALVQHLSREKVVEYLRGRGFRHKKIREAIKLAKSEGIAVAVARAAALKQFIDANCHVVDGAMIPFREFYGRFLASLPKDDRYFWSRYRVSHALPPKHPSGCGTANQKFVANLSWEPMTPGPPLIAVPGKKSHGRARVLVHQ